MRRLILAGAALLAIASAPAFAEGSRAAGGVYTAQAEVQFQSQTLLHYEWQYGYVGNNPGYRGHWVLVH